MAVINDVASQLRSTSLLLRSQRTFIRVFVKDVLGGTGLQQIVNCVVITKLRLISEPMVVPAVTTA